VPRSVPSRPEREEMPTSHTYSISLEFPLSLHAQHYHDSYLPSEGGGMIVNGCHLCALLRDHLGKLPPPPPPRPGRPHQETVYFLLSPPPSFLQNVFMGKVWLELVFTQTHSRLSITNIPSPLRVSCAAGYPSKAFRNTKTAGVCRVMHTLHFFLTQKLPSRTMRIVLLMHT
jgi:hypothetical protein